MNSIIGSKKEINYFPTNLIIYSIGHLFVDAVCCGLILYSVHNIELIAVFSTGIILYDTLAFGLQPIFGLMIDKMGKSGLVAATGCILVGMAAIFTSNIMLAAILAGVGNALFHVGGGVYSLNIDRKKAVYAGIFVAPGAIGLFLGRTLVNNNLYNKWLFFIPMIILALTIFRIEHKNYEYNYNEFIKGKKKIPFVLLLMLLVIGFRAIIGLSAQFQWKNTVIQSLALVVFIAGGKAFGGYLADRFGRRRVAVLALLLSAPLLAFFEGSIYLSLIGVFLFNITMPITLTEIADRLYGYSGFAFGLTTLALVLGAYTIFFGFKVFFGIPIVTFTIILISMLILNYCLKSDYD